VLEDAGYTHVHEWLSLVLTGSLTTYQYGPESDCDISLFVDSEFFPEWSRAEMIGEMIQHVDGTLLPGTDYPLQAYVVPKEITREDLYKPGLRSGYDLTSDSWVEPPDPTRVHDVEREYNDMYVYALQQCDKMERMLRYEPDKAVMFWHQIHQRRQRDQKAGKGDYSQSNIVYKFLANRGLFPELSEVSGEYIAKQANDDIKVKTYQYRANGRHPRTEHGRSFPWVFVPEANTLHIGAADSFHHDLVGNSPELSAILNGANEVDNPNYQFGRMSHPDKVMMFANPNSLETMQALADRVGGSIAPADLGKVQAPEENEWTFG
jgi:hypothetical protein